MRESFVVHSEYLEDLPEEYKATFLMYTYNYGIHGIVPNLTGLELTIWKKIQRRIDVDQETYETTVQKRSEAGKKHKGNQYTKNNPTVEQMEHCSTQMEQGGTNGTVNVFVNDTDIVNDTASTSVNVEQAPTMPSMLPESTQNYSNTILDKYKKANLPCFNGNQLSFMQSDFKNSLPLLKNIHSDDVLQAIDNYIDVLRSPDCWVDRELNFYALVKSDMWIRLLPENFDRTYFEVGAKKQLAPKDIPKILYKGDECKACHKNTLFFNNEKQKYICNSCHKEFSYEEVMYAS